jgi:hypothetical protein
MKIRVALFSLAACATLCTIPENVCAKIFPKVFETNLGVAKFGDEALAKPGTGTVGVYDAKTGTFNPTLITGLHGPQAIAVAGDNLFVVTSGTIGEYDANTGTQLNLSPITLPPGRVGIAAFGDNLFVTSSSTHRIDEYSALTGMLIQAGFVTGPKLKGPAELTVAGGSLFVVNSTTGKSGESIGEYNATTGATVHSSLVTGLHGRVDIAVSGTSLFVASSATQRIDEYDITTGMLVAELVKGLHGPSDIAVFGGDLFVTDAQNQSIDIFSATTGMSEGALPTGPLHGPQGITIVPVSGSVPDASSSWLLLLFGLIATFGLKVIVHQPA